MTKPDDTPHLSLSVQYIEPCDLLPRWRIRQWVQRVIRFIDPELDAIALNIRLTNAEEIQQLNHAFREKKYPTNVLTFPYGIDHGTLSADIVICMDVLQQEASDQQKPLLHHAAHLLVHGVLHAFGYDHLTETEAEEMESLEVEVLAKLGIANPYIID